MPNASIPALSSLAGRLHPALRARLRRLDAPGNRVAGHGLLSVIVPMYNVAPYLERCLTSLVTQSYRDLEIILVDDGSTDGTAALAAGYARYDGRITLVQLAHGGNGRARNEGIRAASGRFLTFADADDVVPSDAYATMVAHLARSGSEFCVGSYGRIRGNKRTPVRLAERIHSQELTGIRLEDCPEAIDDVFLWNKVFRRDFWNRCVGPIPEGIRYEDQETTSRAYLRAESFDILRPVVYWWRIREDGSSITQAKHLLEDLQDRLAVARDVTALFRAEGIPAVQEHWYQRLLGSDMVPYIEQVPDASDEFWQLLRHGVQDLYAAGQKHLARIDPQARVLLFLAANGHREDIRCAVVDRINNGTASPLTFDGGRIFAEPPLLDAISTPIDRDLLEVQPSLLELVVELDEPVPAVSGRISVSGHAYLRNVDLHSNTLDLHVTAPEAEVLLFTRRTDPDIDLFSGDRNCSYAASAFTVELNAPGAELIVGAEVAGHRVERLVPVPRPAVKRQPGSGPAVTALSVLTRNGVDELRFIVEGAPADASYALATARFTLPAEVLDGHDGTLQLRVPLATRRWGRELPAPPSGSYTLRLSRTGGVAGPGDPAVRVDESTARSFRSELLPGARVRGLRTASGAMAVSIGAPLADEETGTFHQYRLRRESFGPAAVRRTRPGIFFESFGGKNCTDSPRAISDYLAGEGFDEPLYWSVADRSVPVPEYAVPLLQGSAEWYDKLASVRVLVNNNNFPWYFRKSPGQFYLQTWHGTPLKKIGLDIPQHLLSLSYRDLMERESQWWDLLLAQNKFAAGVLPKALGYTGEVLTAGYPRNDALLAPDAAETRLRVRTLLGVAPHHKVLLYTPTWRDAVRDGAGRSDWIGFLDVEEASRLLGPDYRFLIRGHHNVAGQRNIDPHPAVIDVTEYPELNDLYLASDALVTDYSSALFDYAVLNRPTCLLVPDLDEYRRTRGLYLEPAADLGRLPVVSTTVGLVMALQAPQYDSMSQAPTSDTNFASISMGVSAAVAAEALLTAAAACPKNATGDHCG
ncbi:bifunctional glycosyltransferase family 2 protein/CDP-glycerol:glycerophosphate glycerophosphotransferase [Arthrobacter zhangbolii]|uniref:Bifunctional glycosyltransferase family 2 protein/CDP-glycerol:glycerophosphate glycerophosphotransferase n=1 Tax=Arthrobacter zhangbolii TaxID=2886936 RepID=A0A9X1M4Z7_9MICC|nr:CDP-glycerol glycerophosphotransferase family protein [Arthrobacter zhangbolii]MCC3271141.1 bifunctional glycosyltransferase family 2 protein/CDP-glycerol:glycerophosphate glycerophosphotransferase [Arthrobacter zhangbolii]UON91063.1 bifunctional glycosyltransferase family 2 protein/CDP-glycerol:glycerophosphate glycerophosphotransferase [Arthrobacter zhangbolii]